MARAWLVDSRGIARKVKNATQSFASQIKDYGANRECPNCHHRIDNSDVSHEWPGLPVGVKFDPSDVQILEHLAAKCGVGNAKPHVLIDEFIPTLDEDKGICYTHPENLPGAKRDGSSIHFFHRTANAYATGQRKRRKIQSDHGSTEAQVRWHKTGKTKPVTENGVQKGCKKIMVLYKSSKKGSKPDKSNWVMHQYHLGTDEDEREGEYVVSKIFYQPQKQTENNDNILVIEELDTVTSRSSPRTPKTTTPNPPRSEKSVFSLNAGDDSTPHGSESEQKPEFVGEASYQNSSTDQVENNAETYHPNPSNDQVENDTEYPLWLAGESQAVEDADADQNGLHDSLLCKEIFYPCAPLADSGLNPGPAIGFPHNMNGMSGDLNPPCGIADLENLELDTPPDFQLADLQFGSQDSIFGWLDLL